MTFVTPIALPVRLRAARLLGSTSEARNHLARLEQAFAPGTRLPPPDP